MQCSAKGCDRNDIKARNLCGMHYARWCRFGSTSDSVLVYRKRNMSLPELAKHIKKNSRKTKNGCREWQRGKDTKGYGLVGVGQILQSVHRVVLAAYTGKPYDNPLYALHHCDNRACVRPKHLYWGTPKDNTGDMVRRRRSYRPTGEHALAKLTVEQVREIRRNYRGRYGEQSDIARKYGMNSGAINQIVRGITWKHLRAS